MAVAALAPTTLRGSHHEVWAWEKDWAAVLLDPHLEAWAAVLLGPHLEAWAVVIPGPHHEVWAGEKAQAEGLLMQNVLVAEMLSILFPAADYL